MQLLQRNPRTIKPVSARCIGFQSRDNLISTRSSISALLSNIRGALKDQATLGLNSKDFPKCMVHSSRHGLDLVPSPSLHLRVALGKSCSIFIPPLVPTAWSYYRTSQGKHFRAMSVPGLEAMHVIAIMQLLLDICILWNR